MAKAKRVPIAFQDSTLALLHRFADVSGQSISGIVSSLIDEAAPAIEPVIEALEKAKTKPIAALDLISEGLARAQHNASQQQLDLIEVRKRHNKRRAKK